MELSYFAIIIGAIFVNNVVLAQFLGICPFLGVSSKVETSMGMEMCIRDSFCPVGGGDCMKAVAAYLGKSAPEKEPQVATVRCGGTCDKRPRTNEYNGARSCAVASSLYVLSLIHI